MRILAVTAAFVVACAVRWATLPGLQGDDHWPLWTAATFLKGDLPFRDFVDVGDPLYWAASALAQALTGYRAIGEIVLGIALVAFAFAVAFHMAWRASGSLGIAAGLTALALLVVTQRELYSYPKIFVYPLGLWLCWRYIDRPGLLRMAALAAGVAIAWGYRHDHGAYVSVGVAAALLAAHWPAGPRRVFVEWLRFAAVLLVILSPYLLLIQLNEGVVQYFRERIALAGSLDQGSRDFVWFRADPDAPAHAFALAPPHPARVFVDWRPDVTTDVQGALERQYSLANGQATASDDLVPPRRRWEYSLTDTGTDNIRAIVEDARVVDTGLIDRETYRPMEESALITLQRALPLFRISVAPRYWHAENAGIVLHYLSFALPYILLAMLGVDRIRGRRRGRMLNAPEKLFTAAVLMAVVHLALLRRVGYFADHIAVAAVLGACVFGHALGHSVTPRRRLARVAAGVATGAVLLVSTLAALTYARGGMPLQELNDRWLRVGEQSTERFTSSTISPPIDGYVPKGAEGDRGLVRYIYECTRPDDRVWVVSDLFPFPYYTERRVVGHIYWANGLLATPEYQRKTIERVEKEEVPIIIGLGRPRGPLDDFAAYPLVREYIAARYTGQYSIPEERGSGDTFWILTDSRRTPSGTYEPFGLPCFR
jgi:hypothetical protein